jgi:hypothetical protein
MSLRTCSQATDVATDPLVSPRTALTVEACHFAPPWPVATPSSFNRFATAVPGT